LGPSENFSPPLVSQAGYGPDHHHTRRSIDEEAIEQGASSTPVEERWRFYRREHWLDH